MQRVYKKIDYLNYNETPEQKALYPVVDISNTYTPNFILVDVSYSTKSSNNKNILTQLKAIIKTARVHQWSKNLILFTPLFLATSVSSSQILSLFIATLAFSLCASSVYFINDILDVKSDRLHPTKKYRPIAKGDLSIPTAIISSCLLLSSSIFLSYYYLTTSFNIILSVYFVLTLGYSLKLKQFPILDVSILSLLYTGRIFAGGVASNIEVSSLILMFSIFFFLSLALLKRSLELKESYQNNTPINSRRGYILDDYLLVNIIGVTSGFLSIVNLNLFIMNDETRLIFEYPSVLFAISFLLTYWLSYVWLVSSRGKMNSDPVLFAITNPTSYIILSIMVVFWTVSKGAFF